MLYLDRSVSSKDSSSSNEESKDESDLNTESIKDNTETRKKSATEEKKNNNLIMLPKISLIEEESEQKSSDATPHTNISSFSKSKWSIKVEQLKDEYLKFTEKRQSAGDIINQNKISTDIKIKKNPSKACKIKMYHKMKENNKVRSLPTENNFINKTARNEISDYAPKK